MSTTVNYKGATLTTVNNQTKVLNTAGRWLEGDITLVDVTSGGITPTGTLNISANGTYDVTNYASAAVSVSGGGTPSQTQHTIYFEFLDNTNQTITGYWDSTFIDSLITGSTPTTIGGKTVTLAQYDGVTWYSYNPSVIPLNTQLIDFNAVSNDTLLDPGTGEAFEFTWLSTSDYTVIDPTMTFTYKGRGNGYVCFYDMSKAFISSLTISEDTGGDAYDTCTGTLTPAKIPASAKYIRINSTNSPDATELSLIRTA